MSSAKLPLAYRWFLAKGLTDWQPWYFMEHPGATTVDLEASQDSYFARQFQIETGADFGVHLFARRQDRDDFAFFLARNGAIEDSTITIHLTFANQLELKTPLRQADLKSTPFTEWVRNVAVVDTADWMNEADMSDD